VSEEYIHVPTDLPVVIPHQEGLDFTITVEKEQELVDEVEQLRKRLDEVRSHPLFSHFVPNTGFL
jgi:hypothetical protein